MRIIAVSLMVLFVFSCRTNEQSAELESLGRGGKKVKCPDISKITNAMPRSQYPGADKSLGEELAECEYEYAVLIANALEKSITKRDKPGSFKRDAHPKTHGCVSADFRVEKNLPKAFQNGVFQPGRKWRGWIRYSNGSSDFKKPDIEGDARGMAIKLLNVDLKEPRLLEIERDATTQDFVLISSSRFIINKPSSYLKLIEASGRGSRLGTLIALGFRGAPVAAKLTSLQIPNPLQQEYFSSVPYQLGTGFNKKSVKYAAIPCDSKRDPLPKNPDPNFLRAAMKSSLSKGPGCFNFMVQRNSGRLSVEDSITEWKSKDAPWQKVATIMIDSQQNFDTPERNKFCENLSFNPWHSVAAHKPLGSTNRIRKLVYEHISRIRHQKNGVPRKEP